MATPAMARQIGFASTEPAIHFDLSRSLSGRAKVRSDRLDSGATGDRFTDEKIRPQVTYSIVDGGPTVELGAFGAGRKGMPKLAHVGVDWSF